MPFKHWLYFIYQYTGQIISFQMMPPLRSFDDVDGRERGQKKTDDLRAMTTLGPRTLHAIEKLLAGFNVQSKIGMNQSLI